MATKRIAAPPNPSAMRAARMAELGAKTSRTPAEVSELLGLLVGEVAHLRSREARSEGRPRAAR